MAGIDSTALFAERASAFGVSDGLLRLLKDGGYGTFGNLAFCSAYQPGSNDEKPLMDAIEAAIGRPLTATESPPVRRLYFEATTMLIGVAPVLTRFSNKSMMPAFPGYLGRS